MNTNETAMGEITAHVAASQFKCPTAQITASPLTTNYYSFIFTTSADSSDIDVFVKIPKTDEERTTIFPLADSDRQLAKREYDSLVKLHKHWPNTHNVQFITPLGYLETHNAIFSERVHARDAFPVFRRWHLQSLIGNTQVAKRFASTYQRLGASLAAFHQSSAEQGTFIASSTVGKIAKYASELEQRSSNAALFQKLSELVNRYDSYRDEVTVVDTLKGLDVRNILITDDDQLYLLDPGLIRREAYHADLARYIVTHEILFWGSPLFAIGVRPSPHTTESFLTGYSAEEDVLSSKTFKILKLKELLKHWSMAYTALRLKQYPLIIDSLLRKGYINRFYEGEISPLVDELLTEVS